MDKEPGWRRGRLGVRRQLGFLVFVLLPFQNGSAVHAGRAHFLRQPDPPAIPYNSLPIDFPGRTMKLAASLRICK